VLRARAAVKFDRADSMLLSRDGLEQANGDVVARHRAGRFRQIDVAGPVLDLCCGIGGDLIAIGVVRDRVVGVDLDEVHATAARHNATVYGVDAVTVVADVTDLRLAGAAAVFVDPARRTGRGSVTRRGGSDPPLEWCLSLPVPRIVVKTAPGLDLATVAPGWEVEFVAVGRELKEAVLWSPDWAGAARRATVLPTDGRSDVVELVPDPATPAAPQRAPGRYLLDPSPAVTRAGAVADLAADLEAWQIDRKIAFLSADRPLLTPFGRCLEIEASLPFALKPLAAELRRLDVGAIDIRRRGLAGDVDELRRRLRPAGSRRATVVLTRVADRPWALVGFDVAGPHDTS
jgi:SAM-dependent methyltransferase